MFTDNNLSFIRNRIYEIRTALLYSLSDKIIKLPTTLISVLKVDEKGQIWFLMNRPLQMMEKNEQKFPARLNFYRKGKPFYMQISGDADFVENRAALSHLFSIPRTIRKAASHNLIVVRLKMTNIEYYEQSNSRPMNTARRILQYIYTSVFAPSPYYQVNFDGRAEKVPFSRYDFKEKPVFNSPFDSLTVG